MRGGGGGGGIDYVYNKTITIPINHYFTSSSLGPTGHLRRMLSDNIIDEAFCMESIYSFPKYILITIL